MQLHINSEIGRLREVIVHPPGLELLAVTPSNRREYLYDDIIDLKSSQEEHRRFTSILAHFAKVRTVRDLLEETLQSDEARNFLVTRSEEVTADKTMRPQFEKWSPKELVERLITGWQQPSGPLSARLERSCYVLPPLPNLFFTRDAAMVIGGDVLISAMRFLSRWPEEVLMRTIFGFHPDFETAKIIYDGSDERRRDYILEGGDIHPLSPNVVVVGISERTSAPAFDHLCELLFQHTQVIHVLAVVLPQRSIAIHLDMVWTQIDYDLCMVYPPLFRGPNRVPILHRRKGKYEVTESRDFFSALNNVGMPMQPVWAGGDQQHIREREQWASGCNLFAVAPGKVVAYARNGATLDVLKNAGFRIVEGEAMLLGNEHVDADAKERIVVTFQGSELVRGGGGPRCMTCPLVRDG